MAISSSSTSKITRDTVSLAVDALLKWMLSQSAHRKPQLLDHDDLLYLVLTLNRISSTPRTNPLRIPLPHPLHPLDSTSTSICLLVDDRPQSPLPPSTARDRIASSSLPIAEVIGLSDLKSNYLPYEARRRLCDSHVLFFADRRILPLLPRLLGKQFFKRKKIPLPVDLSRTGWPEQIKQWCGSTLLYLRSGTCSGLKVGRVSQVRDQIVDNVMAAIEGAVERIPRKWANVRSFHIKFVDSVALPIYQAAPELGFKIEGFEKKIQFRDDEAEKGVVMKKKKKRGRINEMGCCEDEDCDVLGKGEVGVEKKMKKNVKGKGLKKVKRCKVRNVAD